jgi:16S rRNA C1402 (ribose-2'-O) methylase RsmI
MPVNRCHFQIADGMPVVAPPGYRLISHFASEEQALAQIPAAAGTNPARTTAISADMRC